VPLRHFDERVRYCGEFYGQTEEGEPLLGAISAERLAQLLANLPEGITELACHPGDPVGLESTYRDERALEVEALCAPRVLATLDREGIELCSFAEVGR
jgi:predicted glycoside hydrolase/deacetylase ChbG (UPF0249 family)